MRKTTTREEYARRVKRVALYVADHLEDELSLERLAAVACFSPYHLHRIYHAMTGETLGETIRRQRLHRAGVELARSAKPIERVARRAGYGSVEAFTRAFAADHGRPPGAFRASQASPTHPDDGDATMYQVTLKSFEGAEVAALAHRGPYDEINRAFEQLTAFAAARGLFALHARWFAIYHDDPDSVPVRDLRAEACVEITPETALEDGIERLRIEPARVASLVHKGPYSELHRAYQYLYGEWLPASGEEAADRPSFEQYLNNPRQTPASELLTEIFMPLRG